MHTLDSFRLARAGILVFLIFTLVVPSALAMPAAPFPFQEVQPDGSQITLYARGDEHFDWLEDADGYTVVNNNGRFEYARLSSSGHMIPSGLLVGKGDPKAWGLQKRILPSVAVRALSARRIGGANGPTSAEGVAAQAVPPSGTVKNLVVMIRFSNHVSRPLPSVADMDILFNAVGGHPSLAPTGSVKDVYFENSYGQMMLDSYVNPGLSDWITVSGTEQYYANGKSGDSTLWQALREALDVLDDVVDFGDYDTDNDGRIDSIAFIHSGYGAEWSGTDAYGANSANRIWSHRWAIQPQWNSNDGVSVFDYHISPGVWGTSGSAIGRIGVIAHETGHFFGLPDLYDTDGNGSGIGSWGLMANSWDFNFTQRCPPHFSPWSKVNLGWYSPTVISQPGEYQISQAETNPEVYRINSGFSSGEYLLIENRQNAGFDCTIPQGGLAIWHIDDTTGYNVQGYPGQTNWPQNGNHYRVALLQADGAYNLERDQNRGDAGDMHHGAGVDAIGPGPGNHPNTDAYKNGVVTQTGITISDISASGPSMTFCLNGCAAVSAPSGLNATAQSSSNILLSWNDNASDETGYEVERSANGSTWSSRASLAANTESFDDSGLNPVSTWYYRVRAVLGGDSSAWAGPVSATTFDVPPVTPAFLNASGASASAINLSWADSANNEAGYRLQRSATATGGWSTIATKAANSVSHSDTGLASSTTYYYRVAAFNEAGESGYTPANATTFDPPAFVDYVAQSDQLVEGSASGSLSATHGDGGNSQDITEQQSNGNPSKRRSSLEHRWTFDITAGNSVTLSANAWSSGSSDGDQFRFDWAPEGGSYSEAFTVSSGDPDNVQSAVLPATTSGTIYVRVVDTDNSQGNSATDTVMVDHLFIRVDNQPVTPPNAPTLNSAVAASYNQVVLSWTDNASDETAYEVERAVSGGAFSNIATLAAETDNYSDGTVGPNLTYNYRVRAVKGATLSAYSDVVAVTTPPQPAGSINLSANGYKVKGVQHVDLNWSGASGANVDVKRSGSTVTTVNDGEYTDNIGVKGGGSYEYKLCNAGTETCSAPQTVTF